LFVDKQDLTNGIHWFISCAMNANEIIPYVVFFSIFAALTVWRKKRFTEVKPSKLRLELIKEYGHQLSIAAFTAAVLGMLGTLLLIFFLIRNGTIFNLPQHRLLGDFGVIVFVFTLTVGAWFAHKLFQQYSRGKLFTTEVVQNIYQVGRFYIFAIVEKYFLDGIWEKQHLQPLSSFIPIPLFAGGLIFFIAWILDEGRKIQEEQELTV
jgi:hypothetical protein